MSQQIKPILISLHPTTLDPMSVQYAPTDSLPILKRFSGLSEKGIIDSNGLWWGFADKDLDVEGLTNALRDEGFSVEKQVHEVQS